MTSVLWRSFLLDLSQSLGEIPMIYWVMKSGAEFHMLLPTEGEIEEETFADHLHFPFMFDEILRLLSSTNMFSGETSLRGCLKICQEF